MDGDAVTMLFLKIIKISTNTYKLIYSNKLVSFSFSLPKIILDIL